MLPNTPPTEALTPQGQYAEHIPSAQAPNRPRFGQRQYLRHLRRLYAANLCGSGMNRAARRNLSREVKFA